MTRELYHHGILGQKWGVRRYQNPDGSLTAAGRKRYGIESVKKEDLIAQMNKNARSGKAKSQKAIEKRWEEAERLADKTDTGKLLNKVNAQIEDFGSNAYYTQSFIDEYNKLAQDYFKIASDYMNQPEFRNKIASMIIDELGYENTKAGREYILNLMGEFRYQ